MAEKNYTLREASEFLGISVKALRYRIKTLDLELRMVQGPHGSHYVLGEEELALLGRPPSQVGESPEEGPQRVPNDPPQNDTHVEEGPEDSSRMVPLEAHLTALELMRTHGRLMEQAREERLEAEERLSEVIVVHERLQRQHQTLLRELRSYQNLLTENAESISEREAKIRQAEEQRTLSEHQLEELYRHNAEQKEAFEKQKQEMSDQIKLAEERVAWFEKRVPNWVRKLFGAG